MTAQTHPRRHLVVLLPWWRERRPWVLPAAYVALALGLGLTSPHFGTLRLEGLLSRVASSSAVAVLSAVASGMMALTAITFSFVFFGIQAASASYSPRVVRELHTRSALPHAFGIFAGTFVYAVLAIRSVDVSGRTGVNAPVMWLGLLWLLTSAVALLLLVPQIQGITLTRLLASLGDRGRAALERLYPPLTGDDGAAPTTADARPEGALDARALLHDGPPRHLVALDVEALVAEARRVGARVQIPMGIGDVILRGDPLALLVGGSRPWNERRVKRAVVLACDRTVENDPAFSLRLIVDIAIRALSPAVNDPTTAVMALHQIESLLRRYARSRLDVGRVADADGVLRLVYETPTFDDLLSLALLEIQQYGRESTQVERCLSALLHDLVERVSEPRRPCVRRLLTLHEATLRSSFSTEEERQQASRADRLGLGHTADGAAPSL